MKLHLTQRNGSMTLMTVFLSAMVAFMLLMGDNLHAIARSREVLDSATSEQAFYASQSCMEEAFGQLRTNQGFSGTLQLAVGNADCAVTITPTALGATTGSIISRGHDDTSIRTVSSAYSTRLTITRLTTEIFHVIDRSGSMVFDTCSDTQYHDEKSCTKAGETWGVGTCSDPQYTTKKECEKKHNVWTIQLEPFTSAKVAAKTFNDQFMQSEFDQVGVVSFSDGFFMLGNGATLEHSLTSSTTDANAAIDQIADPLLGTNIGGAIETARQNFSGGPASRVIILLTDGEQASIVCTIECALEQARIAKEDYGIRIFTIGLGTPKADGGSLDEAFLKTISSTDENGQPLYMRAPTRNDLGAIYQQIAGQIKTYTVGQTSWDEE